MKLRRTDFLLVGLGGVVVAALVLALFTVSGSSAQMQPAGSDVEAGAALYSENCASCHGDNLEGEPNWQISKEDGTLPAPPHDQTGHTWHHGDALLFDYTKQGGQAAMAARGVTSFTSGMPGFGDTLTDQEIWDVLAFIKSTWPDRIRQMQETRSRGEQQKETDMRRILHPMIAALALSLTAPATATDLTADEIKQLALQAIRENPEIVMEAVEILQSRDAQAAVEAAARVLSEQRLILEQDPNAPAIGNPEGDVTVVEFFDYNCPYCKRAASELETLLADDPNIRVVFREWPILGDGSVFAARAALAARKQDKYEAFHFELMTLRGRAEEASVLAAAEKVGLDMQALRAVMGAPDVEDHINESMRLAELPGFNGTPSFVIGDALVPGFVPIDELERLVGEARAAE